MSYVQELKEKSGSKFILYVDLHGHSIKKNMFAYGPEFTIQEVTIKF